MPKTIAFTNQKGGVGKTTSCISIASYLAIAGHRVLVIDSDPQGNCTSGLGCDVSEISHFSGQKPIQSRIERIDVVPSGDDLEDFVDNHDRQRRFMADGIDSISLYKKTYDYILIDCPPAVHFLTTTMISQSEFVVIPVQAHYFALEGLGQIINQLEKIRATRSSKISIAGVIVSMVDPKSDMSGQIEEQIKSELGSYGFVSVVPYDPALASAPSHGQPIAHYNPISAGALAYLSATKELIRVVQ